MAITSPRASAQANPLDTASSVPLDWHDPVEHRRKLAEAIRDVSRYTRGLPSYAGVWRALQVAPAVNNTTTNWAPLLGYTEDRPAKPKKATSDITTGELVFYEPGEYNVGVSISYEGKINRFYDWGARINGVDPAGPTVRQECLTATGDMLMTFVTTFTITNVDVPASLILVVKSEIATTLEFEVGGWYLERYDYWSI